MHSFCPRLLSKMELLSTGDSCRAICFCSLGTGAQEQVFADIDGSERHIRGSRYTTSLRSPFSFGQPRNPRSGDHECAWASNIKDSGKNPYWGDNRWQAAVWWGISCCPPPRAKTAQVAMPSARRGRRRSWRFCGHLGTLVLADFPTAGERNITVVHFHSGRRPRFVFTQRCIQRRTGATVWLATATPTRTKSLRMWWCLYRWPRDGVQDWRLPHL